MRRIWMLLCAVVAASLLLIGCSARTPQSEPAPPQSESAVPASLHEARPQLKYERDLAGVRMAFEPTTTPPRDFGDLNEPAAGMKRLYVVAWYANPTGQSLEASGTLGKPTLTDSSGRAIEALGGGLAGGGAVEWVETTSPDATATLVEFASNSGYDFTAAYDVSESASAYAFTWNLGAGRPAKFEFRY